LRDVLGQSARYVWHKDTLSATPMPWSFQVDSATAITCAVAPSRDSVGDAGGAAIRGHGGLVLGICNGFQVLCEAGLLAGALIRNRSLQFRCEHVYLKTLTADLSFTNQIPPDKLLKIPIAHGEGCYFRRRRDAARTQSEQPNPLAILQRSGRSD